MTPVDSGASADAPASAFDPFVVVDASGGAFALRAGRTLRVGALVVVCEGDVVDEPGRWSLQIGIDRHLVPPADASLEQRVARHPWCFLNHSCDPNTLIRARSVLALRPIARGDELTFDYNTTEYAMSEPFECRCGAPTCCGWVRGYRHLDAVRRRALAPLVARHVLDLAAAEPPAG